MMRWKRQSDTGEQENPFNLSISDLMAGVLVIFILTLVSMFINYKGKADNIDSAPQYRAEILDDIYNEVSAILNDDKAIDKDEERGSIIIRADSMGGANGIFDNQNSHLNSVGERKVEALAVSIAKIKERYEKDPKQKAKWNIIDTIMIEGHTDTKPYPGIDAETKKPIDKNLQLSTDRAVNTWLYMQGKKAGKDSKESLGDYTNNAGEKLFSVAGYGKERPLKFIREPIIKNGKVELEEDGKPKMRDRTLNGESEEQRRIEIRFIIRPQTGNEEKEVKQ